MRNINVVAFISALSLVVAPTAAFAGTEVFNRYSTTNTYNGYTETDVNVDVYTESYSTEHSVTESFSIKAEGTGDYVSSDAYASDYEGRYFYGDQESVTGGAWASGDDTATTIVTGVEQTTVTFSSESSVEDVTVDTFSSNEFNGHEFEHTAGNRSN